MNRNAEAALVGAATILAAAGVGLVNLTSGTGVGAQAALTLISFGIGFGLAHLALRRWAAQANAYVLPLAAFLTAVGFTEVYRIDPELASLQRWSIIIAGGAAAGLVFLLRNDGVAVLRRYRYLFLAAGVVLLLLPLLPTDWPIYGAEVSGSRLWVRINLPFEWRTLSFQPGEVAKVFLVIFLASYLADRSQAMATVNRHVGRLSVPEPRHLGPVLIAAGFSFIVLIYQRDLGASLLLFAVFIAMLYVATGRTFYLGTGAILAALGGLVAYQLFDHVPRRVFAWLHPFDDFAGAGYQIAQGLFAMGSGSLTGSGIGLGQPDLIPAAATDFVFAAIAEEMGLAGSVAVLVGYALFATLGFGMALRSRDLFRKYLAAGLTIVVALQALLIIAGIVRLLPVTGIAQPFMSYGGSALLANMVIVALLARVSHEERT